MKSFVISTMIKTEIGQNVYHRYRKTYKNTSFKKILDSEKLLGQFGHCQKLSGRVSGTHQTLVEVL